MDRSISTSKRHGKLEKQPHQFRDAQHVMHIAQRIASAIGRRIDESSPMVDARLADGSRVNIIVAPLALNGGTISIRKFPTQNITLDTMVQQKNLSPTWRGFLDVVARCRANILISGGTGSGKTTLLNAISRHVASDERIITIEDAVELRLQQPACRATRINARPTSRVLAKIAQRNSSATRYACGLIALSSARCEEVRPSTCCKR